MPVYGLGVDERGQPYYAMRLIRGKTLAHRIRKFFHEHAKTKQPFQTREFLRLIDHFLAVCQTIAFAHDRGILHRDIKPVNVMVGKYGETFVVDWGLAKSIIDPHDTVELAHLHDENSDRQPGTATRYGTALGTPAYAPPEQVLGNLDAIDERSDIYGLGAILFEILTGEPPVCGKNVTELIERASHGELRDVLQLQPNAPKPLVSVCRKCLSFSSNVRYAKVEELIADVERWKADLPVSVHPEGFTARLMRWTRRHRGATLSTLGGALAVAIIGTTSALVIFRQKQQVELLAQREQVARGSAETVRDLLVETFQSPDPLRDSRLITVSEVLNSAAKRIDEDLAADPMLQATMNLSIGQSLLGLGLPQDAVTRLELASKAFEGNPAASPETALIAKRYLGIALRRAGRIVDSVNQLKASVEYASRTFGDNSGQTLDVMTDYGESLLRAGDADKAVQTFRTVLDLRRKHDGIATPQTLVALHGLASARLQAGRLIEADADFASAYEGRRKVLGDQHLLTLSSLAGHAECQLRAGHLEEAVKQYRQVLEGRTKKLGEDHPDRLATLSDLAGALRKADQNEEAIALLEEAYRRFQTKLGNDHPETLGAAGNLAEAYESIGRVPDSIPLLEATILGMRQKFPEDHPDLLNAQHNLAYVLQTAGKNQQAVDLYQKVVTARQKTLGESHPDTLTSMAGEAEALAATGETARATDLLNQVLTGRIKLWGTHIDIATTRAQLASIQLSQGLAADALENYDRAVEELTKLAGASHVETLIARSGQARCWLELGRQADAITAIEEIHAQLSSSQGTTHPKTLLVGGMLGNAYRTVGQYEQAIPLLEESADKLTDTLGRDHPSRLEIAYQLAAAYCGAKLFEEADQFLSQMLDRQLTASETGRGSIAAETARQLSACRIEANRPREAVQSATMALQLAEDAQPIDSSLVRNCLRTAAVAHTIARAPLESEKCLRRLVALCEADANVAVRERLSALDDLSVLLIAQQRDQEALTVLRALLPEWETATSKTSTESLRCGLELAKVLHRTQAYADAVNVLEARSAAMGDVQQEPLQRWEPLVLLGDSQLQLGQHEAALKSLDEAHKIAEQAMPGSWPWAWSTVLHARALMLNNDQSAAHELLQVAVPALQSQRALLPRDLQSLPDTAAKWLDESSQ